MSKQVTSKEEIAAGRHHLAPTTTRTSASCMADAIEKVGKDGVITVEEGKTTETDARVRRGHAVRQGLHLARTSSPTRRRWRPCSKTRYILLHEKKIRNLRELLPLLEKVVTRRASRC